MEEQLLCAVGVDRRLSHVCHVRLLRASADNLGKDFNLYVPIAAIGLIVLHIDPMSSCKVHRVGCDLCYGKEKLLTLFR